MIKHIPHLKALTLNMFCADYLSAKGHNYTYTQLHLTANTILPIVLATIPARPLNNAQIGGLLFFGGCR